MSQSVHANSLTAIVGLPIAIANAHIVGGTFAVAITSIGTLSINDIHKRSHTSGNKNKMQHEHKNRY